MKRRPVILSVNKMKHVKHKIVITGDSHARNCAADQHSLSSTFAVSSYQSPFYVIAPLHSPSLHSLH